MAMVLWITDVPACKSCTFSRSCPKLLFKNKRPLISLHYRVYILVTRAKCCLSFETFILFRGSDAKVKSKSTWLSLETQSSEQHPLCWNVKRLN